MVAHGVPIRRDSALQVANGLQGSPTTVAQLVPYGFDRIRPPDRRNLGSLEKLVVGIQSRFVYGYICISMADLAAAQLKIMESSDKYGPHGDWDKF